MGSPRRRTLGCALAWSCVFHGGLTRKPASFLTTSDAVVAVRLGSGSSTAGDDFRYDDYDGWIVLLDADGRGQVAAVNNVLGGDVVWNERGVFYAASSHDFLTTQAGTQEIGRGDRSDERQRYALPDGALAVVSGEEFGYEVDTVHVDGRVASVENDKTGGSVGQCGARILAITTRRSLAASVPQRSRRMLLDRVARRHRPPSRLLFSSMTMTARSLQSSR